mmetsp:Transcript_50004/g.132830  ORF Transcript_50004/g.132830 Transcript_50004/m.132830 type:complete len:443 (+) Transcript_50004:130-1458(+)
MVRLELRVAVQDRGRDAVENALRQVGEARHDLAVGYRGALADHEVVVPQERLKVTQVLQQGALLRLDQLLAQAQLDLRLLLLRHVLRVAILLRLHPHVQRRLDELPDVLLEADRLLDLERHGGRIQPRETPAPPQHRAALREGLGVANLHQRQLAVLRRRLHLLPLVEANSLVLELDSAQYQGEAHLLYYAFDVEVGELERGCLPGFRLGLRLHLGHLRLRKFLRLEVGDAQPAVLRIRVAHPVDLVGCPLPPPAGRDLHDRGRVVHPVLEAVQPHADLDLLGRLGHLGHQPVLHEEFDCQLHDLHHGLPHGVGPRVVLLHGAARGEAVRHVLEALRRVLPRHRRLEGLEERALLVVYVQVASRVGLARGEQGPRALALARERGRVAAHHALDVDARVRRRSADEFRARDLLGEVHTQPGAIAEANDAELFDASRLHGLHHL